mgnify:CR=1 FL=1
MERLTAAEMLEDFASDAGTFEMAAVAVEQGPVAEAEDKARWEKRLRRALGDDYELLFTVRPRLRGRRLHTWGV